MVSVEQKRATQRRYYHSHKEICSDRFKRWSKQNKERRKEYMDSYNAKRKESQKEYDRIRYLRPENVAKRERLKLVKKQYNQSYHKRNRERWLVRCYRDRALKRKNLVGNLQDISKWMRSWRTHRLVRCYWCGSKTRGIACHGDHIIALSDGGAHSLENLCISCAPCNMRKHDKPLEIWNTQIEQPVLL